MEIFIMTNTKAIKKSNPDSVHKPTGYTHMVEVTGVKTIYISGQVALDRQGNVVGENDMQKQTQQVFENLKLILESSGANFTNVVKITYFLVDISQIQIVRNVRDQYFSPDEYPASTAVEVKGLARKEFLLEIEAIAVI
jgi:reactive intermediate/imine deaminase